MIRNQAFSIYFKIPWISLKRAFSILQKAIDNHTGKLKLSHFETVFDECEVE